MKRSALLSCLILLVAGQSLGQDGRRQRLAAAAERPQPMPLQLGKTALGRPLMLRSWVQGWSLTGTRPDAYELRCEEIFSACSVPILRTRTFAGEPYGMGSLTHTESAQTWRGTRVEVRAELRAGRVGGWAGLWMRVDGPDGKVLAFDNMQDRALRGTSSFEWYSVVLDVPQDAERVTFGVMLHGPGAVYVRELVFGEVDAAVATTDLLGPLRGKEAVTTREPPAAPAP